MAKIFTNMHDRGMVYACYERYLLGEKPAQGSVLAVKSFLYILRGDFELPGRKLATPYGEILTALDSEEQSLAACREFLGGRRLPAGAGTALSARGISVFPDSRWEAPADLEEFRFTEDFTLSVMTAEEAGSLYGREAKQVAADCGNGVFRPGEARRSRKSWLLTKEAACRVYGGGAEENTGINPLLLVFTTLEAAELWNRDSGDVRSAASGAGHRAARMWDGDRRKSGRVWLVTRFAMERLYGPPVPERMKAAMETARG